MGIQFQAQESRYVKFSALSPANDGIQEMADLTKELAVEKLNNESWTADKIARMARVASRNPTSNAQKSLFRQMAWCSPATRSEHFFRTQKFWKNRAFMSYIGFIGNIGAISGLLVQ